MELLLHIWSLLTLSLLHHHTSAHSIVATCARSEDYMPKESWITVWSNPSPLHDLDLQLIEQSRPLDPLSLNVRWSINIDSSIHSVTGTWIELNIRSHTKSYTVNYRCDYQPPFTSNQDNYTGLEQLWFSFTSTEVHVEPEGSYKATVYNLPISPESYSNTQSKSQTVSAPGCEDKQMSTHSICKPEEPLTIAAVHEGDEIVVSFKSQAGSQEYDILLLKAGKILNETTEQTDGNVRNITKIFHYSEYCENLTVMIIPYLKKCSDVCRGVEHGIDCNKNSKPEPLPKKESPLFSIGCAVGVILMLFCLCILCKLAMGLCSHGLTTIFTGPVRVLIVYPAVDCVFQHAVMALADFLDKNLNVVIDMWQRVSLAEQGPLRWLHSEADQADKVLIILPPQDIPTRIDIDTDHQKLHLPDYTVPASAQELYSLALNLVASSAHDPQHNHKFWVVHLGQGGKRHTVPVQLRGCKTLHLPRDLEKLHQKLVSRQDKKCNRIWSLQCRLNSKKLRQTLQQLDRSQLNRSEGETAHLTQVQSHS